jgi:hypothetical protein
MDACLIIRKEAEACGCIDADLVRWGTPAYGRLWAMGATDSKPRCLACQGRPEVPQAFVEISARDKPTIGMPIPVCAHCCRKPVADLQNVTMALLDQLAPGAPVRFISTPKDPHFSIHKCLENRGWLVSRASPRLAR